MRAEAAETAYREVAHLRALSLDPDVLGRLARVAGTVVEHTARATNTVARIEAPVNAALAAGARRSAELGEERRRLSALESDARREAVEAGRRAAEAEVVLARLGGVRSPRRRPRGDRWPSSPRTLRRRGTSLMLPANGHAAPATRRGNQDRSAGAGAAGFRLDVESPAARQRPRRARRRGAESVILAAESRRRSGRVRTQAPCAPRSSAGSSGVWALRRSSSGRRRRGRASA